MSKTDRPVRRLIQIKPADWVKLAIPELQNSNFDITELNPNKIPKVESKLDTLFWIADEKGNKSILNIEPQGYKEEQFPARMLRYCADVYEYTLGMGLGLPPIKQIVVLFYPKDEQRISKSRCYGSNVDNGRRSFPKRIY